MMTLNRSTFRRYLTLVAGAVALSWGAAAQAHCDTLDGPVVTDARKALDTGNVNMVLGWVQKKDEAEVRDAFQKSVNVRKTGATGKELADRYFFETLVREVFSERPEPARIESARARIAEVQVQQQKRVIAQFLQEREILNAGQRRELVEVLLREEQAAPRERQLHGGK